jgi:transposase
VPPFVAFLRDIDARVDPELEVHVVLDNLSAHRAPAVHRWLLRHTRFHLHYTPTYASWLDLVERFFGMLTEKALRRGSHTSVTALRAAILAYDVFECAARIDGNAKERRRGPAPTRGLKPRM